MDPLIFVGIFIVGRFLIGFIQKWNAKKMEERYGHWNQVLKLDEISKFEMIARRNGSSSGTGRTYTTVKHSPRTNTAQATIRQESPSFTRQRRQEEEDRRRQEEEDRRWRSTDDGILGSVFLTTTLMDSASHGTLPEPSTDTFSGGGGSFGGGGSSGSWDTSTQVDSSPTSFDSGPSGSFGSD